MAKLLNLGCKLWTHNFLKSIDMRIFAILSALTMLSGCIPRVVVVHDGVDARVIDANTRKPIEGAYVFDRLDAQRPHVLALSDKEGHIVFEPKTRLSLVPLMGEALVNQYLWLCKDGFIPIQIGGRFGWNADYAPKQTMTVGVVELKSSALPPAESCADVKF